MIIYIAEVARSDSVLGICLFTNMLSTTIQSLTSTFIMNSSLGIHGLFYTLSGIQLVAFIFFLTFMMETQGLCA